MNNKEIGKYGEDIVCDYLKQNNYEIIERNFLCKLGEIDIIAQDKDEIVFIEVKTRTEDMYGMPAEAVDLNKQKHIYRAGEYYLLINNLLDAYVRIDVAEVYLKNNNFKINYIKKAIIE